ncbi:hypothetical protein [Paraglaciecola sp.]|uniref:hypothetical protein n=1 Tax=Paraglaciecola sp. TaxID=1920173 RepID=UPI0030F45530
MIILRLLLLNILLLSSVFILWPSQPYLLAIISLSLLILMFSVLHNEHRQRQLTLNALKDGLLNLLDSNFSISLGQNKSKSGQDLVIIFNQVADKLRHERQHIYQRELMLDKVVNQSNILTILVNSVGIVVFANHAAQHFFCEQQSLSGKTGQVCLKIKHWIFIKVCSTKAVPFAPLWINNTILNPGTSVVLLCNCMALTTSCIY